MSQRSQPPLAPQDTPSLWTFATDFYAQPGVAETCLRLQDEHDFDVNLLLFCCWYGVYFGVAEEALMQTLHEYSCDWQENAVRPLRNTRRWLKTKIAASPGQEHELGMLREKVKELELATERQQLETLAAMALALEPGASTLDTEQRCAENLQTLQRLMHSNEEAASAESSRELLGHLVHALPT